LGNARKFDCANAFSVASAGHECSQVTFGGLRGDLLPVAGLCRSLLPLPDWFFDIPEDSNSLSTILSTKKNVVRICIIYGEKQKKT
jgi:hypothetical protein